MEQTNSTNYGYSPEQIKEMQAAFNSNDITKRVSLEPSADMSLEKAKVYVKTKKVLSDYWMSDLRELGIKRFMKNFSRDYPIKVLNNGDGDFFARQIAEMYTDSNQFEKAVEQFFEMYDEQICIGLEGYAESIGKDIESLTKEEIGFVIEKVADVINEELVKVMMLGQQVPEVYSVGRKNPAEEDYYIDKNGEHGYSWDYINYLDKWTHYRTKLGRVLLFSELEKDPSEDEMQECDGSEDECSQIESAQSAFSRDTEQEEREYKELRDAFVETLSGVDLEIFYMCEADLTRAEIASRLGYASPGTITKRVKNIQKKLNAFLSSVEKSAS
jgi:hypothetical protein